MIDFGEPFFFPLSAYCFKCSFFELSTWIFSNLISSNKFGWIFSKFRFVENKSRESASQRFFSLGFNLRTSYGSTVRFAKRWGIWFYFLLLVWRSIQRKKWLAVKKNWSLATPMGHRKQTGLSTGASGDGVEIWQCQMKSNFLIWNRFSRQFKMRVSLGKWRKDFGCERKFQDVPYFLLINFFFNNLF